MIDPFFQHFFALQPFDDCAGFLVGDHGNALLLWFLAGGSAWIGYHGICMSLSTGGYFSRSG